MAHLIGQKAPDFNCMAYVNGEFKKVSFKDYKGKWLVLFFYPLDFTFICPTEIRGFATKSDAFRKLNCEIVGASTDSEHSHKAWFQRDLPEVKFPVLADSTHMVSSAYGVLKEDQGVAYRATVVIDPDGFVRYYVVSDLDVGRSVDETMRVVEALQTGELCPVDWKPGMAHVGNKKK